MPGSDARPLPRTDLDDILEGADGLWDDLRGARLFVTGGTGFFGRWMIESFLHANQAGALGASAVVLTRDPDRARARAPHLDGVAALEWRAGDVRTFEAPAGDFTHILHLATESGPTLTPESSYDTAVHGTRRVLDFGVEHDVQRMLLASSGAIYGAQPATVERISEDEADSGTASPSAAVTGYAEGKRAAEAMCAEATASSDVTVTTARCFAFVGPLLPLDANFAIGNFVRDALTRRVVEVQGDGTSVRSYLYAGDLAVWLWTILLRGEGGRAYNVGAEEAISIGTLAQLVADTVAPGVPVRIAGTQTTGSSRYVPSTARARGELGLRPTVYLAEAIRRTADWHRP